MLPSEVRATTQVYLDEKINQWFSLEDRNGVALIPNVTTTDFHVDVGARSQAH
jgi:hypothetical protein